MNDSFVVVRKEWLEIWRQPMLVFTILFPPVLLTILPMIIVAASAAIPVNAVSLSLHHLEGLSPHEAAQAMLGAQFSLVYFLLPPAITSVLASHSIVGEKTSRTLEPLLATPVSTWDLLIGKCLAALLPALCATWVGAAIFVAAMVVETTPVVFRQIVSPGWLVLTLLWAPLLAFVAIAVMVGVSARVNDPRTAQQFGTWVVVPFLVVFMGEAAGAPVLGAAFVLAGTILLALAAALALWLATRLFQREVILTRWK